MWNISVAPMPSMISMPVASSRARASAAGSASPAATHLRSGAAVAHAERAARARRSAIARYEVGAVKQHGRALGGDRVEQLGRAGLLEQHGRGADAHREQRQAAEPEREGERRAADEDVVGARRAARAAESTRSDAITSRWKCIVAFGWPVVPDVKASRQVSSAAVSTLANGAPWRAMQRFERRRRAALAEADDVRAKRRGELRARALRARRAAPRRRARCAHLRLRRSICPSSLARSSGIVADRDAARLHHREPAGDEHRLVGGAQQHAVARARGRGRATSTWAMRSAWRCSSA